MIQRSGFCFRCEGCVVIGFLVAILLGSSIPSVILIPQASRIWRECDAKVISCSLQFENAEDRPAIVYEFELGLNWNLCNSTVIQRTHVYADSSANCTLYGERWRNHTIDCYPDNENPCDITLYRPLFLQGSWETSQAFYRISITGIILGCVVAVGYLIARILQYRHMRSVYDRIEYDL